MSVSLITEESLGVLSGNLTAVLVFMLVTTAIRLFLIQKKPKHRLPGPLPLPLVGNAHSLLGSSSRRLKVVLDLVKQYNGTVRLWIGGKLHVFISDPEDLEIFFSNPKVIDKSWHYNLLDRIIGKSVFAANGAEWKEARNVMLPHFKPLLLNTKMSSFMRNARKLVEFIGKESGKPPFDVYHYIRSCTNDIIFESIMGREISSQIEKKHEKFLNLSEEMMDISHQRLFSIWKQWDFLYWSMPEGKYLMNIINYLNNYAEDEIRKSLDLLKKGEMNSRMEGEILVEYIYKTLGEKKFENVRHHVINGFYAGYDTTSGTLCFIIMMLGMHQDVQQKLFEEISQITADNNGQDPTIEDLPKMEYLERVIKETLRLFPIAPMIFRQAKDNVKMGKRTIPRGAAVACVMAATHRNPKIFPQPDKFNPDNFLAEKIKARHPYAFVPFSAGPRGCIGRKFGVMSIKVIISQLVAHYQIFCDMKMEEMVLKPEFTTKLEGGFPVRIQSRALALELS